VRKKLERLNPSSAPGPDKVYPRFLKECAGELSVPLAIIYEKSLNECKVPDDWKSTNITPIYKKGPKNRAENYRPINVASVPGKIMESVLKDSILDHLKTNKCLICSQHGFVPGRSVTTNLIEYLNVITATLDDGIPFDTIMVDFRRAFDRVPFAGMLSKAKAHGIDGELLGWITDWTIGRKQRVVLNGVESDWTDVTSSVVQGSVLGPVLFLIYINCIDLSIRAHDEDIFVSKFADDTKLGRKITSVNDSVSLQRSLDSLQHWCDKWGMQLHPDKCVVIHFGKTNPCHDYHIGQFKLNAVDGARDLGVTITNDCDPAQHVENISKKAHVVLSQLKRATSLRDSQTFGRLYQVYVRPLLEAAAPAWNPTKRESVNQLEKVQRRATRMITDVGSLSYDERLRALGLDSLEERRRRGDLIQCYKVMNGYGDIDPGAWFSFVQDRHNVNTRTHAADHILQEKCQRNTRKNFYTNRVVKDWNELPFEVKNARSTNAFKNLYDAFHDQLYN